MSYLAAGGYNQKNGGDSVKISRFHREDGTLTELSASSETVNASWLSIRGNRMLAVNELDKDCSFDLYQIESSLQLKHLSRLTVGRAAALCHICWWADGEHFTGADYTSGDLLFGRIVDGKNLELLNILIPKEESPYAGTDRISHIHSSIQSADGNYLYVCDLGLDRIFVYRAERSSENVKLVHEPEKDLIFPEGDGPRHMAFSADHRFLYVISELHCHIFVFEMSENGSGRLLQKECALGDSEASADGKTADGIPCRTNACAEIAVDGQNRYLYASNRGDNSITRFLIDEKTGRITFAGRSDCGGDWPRHFEISPDGNYMSVSNQGSNMLTVFRIDRESGALADAVSQISLSEVSCGTFFEG